MGAKKNEPREIPIQFGDGGEAGESPDETPAENTPAEAAAAPSAASASAADDSAGGEPVAADEALTPTEASLQVQIDQLTQERAALFDQLLRRQAEFENYRRRSERERAEQYQRARADVILELLPVLDNFERAMESMIQGASDDALRQGVELIHRQFKDTLTRLGLEPVEAVGQTFDPHVHEAVTAEPSDEHEENTVIAELQRGYRLGDRLLRPAKVKVASGSAR